MSLSNTSPLRTLCMAAAASAALLLPTGPTRAFIACASGTFAFHPDGTTSVLGRARAGQPCEIWFGNYAALNDHTLSPSPAHGTAIWNQSSITRNFVVYTPQPKYTGTDYFQYSVMYTPDRRGRRARVLIRIYMTVTS
jgi:hypothetical protein